MNNDSPLQQERLKYIPTLPKDLQNLKNVKVIFEKSKTFSIPKEIANLFPRKLSSADLSILKKDEIDHAEHGLLRVGVVFSGGQAPGGHNVIWGLYTALKELNPNSLLFGFCDGPIGIIKNKSIPITKELLERYKNQGGFDLLGSGRDKISSLEQFQAAENTVNHLNLDGLVMIGGDDSNTNAAFLAEHFSKCTVVGVPKTIDGDLKTKDIEVSFGFDTACKIYSEMIGNLCRDALSLKKYYYFVKLMGRSASHITLECALATHPNMVLIGEECRNKSMKAIVSEICDLICKRSAIGKDYGVILIPEGLIEFIPEIKQEIKEQMGLSFDAHHNIEVSKIETERFLIDLVKKELIERKFKGNFSPQPIFYGYEGRSCFPSNFDSQYCYALGHVAALLVAAKATGYLCCLKHLIRPPEEWVPTGIPIVQMLAMEERLGKLSPVVAKALVDLKGAPFSLLNKERGNWALTDEYRYPGPIQFFGPRSLTDSVSLTLLLESNAQR